MRKSRGLEGLPHVASIALSGICLAAGWLIWDMTRTDIDISPIAPPARASASVGPAPAPVAFERDGPAGDGYPDILRRPLLAPDRRPALTGQRPSVRQTSPTRSAGKPQVRALPDGLKLVGVVLDPGRERMALLSFKSRPEGLWVRAGDMIGGWRLAQIGAEQVVIEADETRRVLSLYPVLPDQPQRRAVQRNQR